MNLTTLLKNPEFVSILRGYLSQIFVQTTLQSINAQVLVNARKLVRSNDNLTDPLCLTDPLLPKEAMFLGTLLQIYLMRKYNLSNFKSSLAYRTLSKQFDCSDFLEACTNIKSEFHICFTIGSYLEKIRAGLPVLPNGLFGAYSINYSIKLQNLFILIAGQLDNPVLSALQGTELNKVFRAPNNFNADCFAASHDTIWQTKTSFKFGQYFTEYDFNKALVYSMLSLFENKESGKIMLISTLTNDVFCLNFWDYIKTDKKDLLLATNNILALV